MPIQVRTDDRLRTVGALLAASDWPAYEQSVKAYKAHRVADAAHKFFAAHAEHSAVAALRQLAGDGEGLSVIYAHAFNDDWPGGLGEGVKDFASTASVAQFFDDQQADFEQAEADAVAVLGRADLSQFLFDLLGANERAYVFVPNLLYPGRQPVAVASLTEVVVTAPPPIAWGTSHPWRYSERPDEALGIIGESFARFLFTEKLPPDLQPRKEVLGLAAAVLFLREAEGQDAGDQLMVMQKKTRGLKQLPAVVMQLETILADRRAGQYPNGVEDYMARIES
ncbi:MAG: hypothetical protein ACT4QE_12810 [Anaerolineales bacterium]